MSREQAELKDVFVRGDRYSLLAAITTEGYIGTCVVPGLFDSFEFYNFVAEEVVCIVISSFIAELMLLSPAAADEAIPRRTICPRA